MVIFFNGGLGYVLEPLPDEETTLLLQSDREFCSEQEAQIDRLEVALNQCRHSKYQYDMEFRAFRGN